LLAAFQKLTPCHGPEFSDSIFDILFPAYSKEAFVNSLKIGLNPVLIALVILFGGPALLAAETTKYKLDETHAAIVFKVNHLGFSNVYGMFRTADGNINWNPDQPDKSSFEITVKANSLDSMNAKRDEHLKGPDFFNVKQFPNIILKSKSIKRIGDRQFEVVADLTLRGTTKTLPPFVFNQMNTGKDPWGKFRTGGETIFKIKRTDFGMTYMSKPGEIGDEVEMIVSIEGIKI
jgi:polyisoprenoid-binding protein YceI